MESMDESVPATAYRAPRGGGGRQPGVGNHTLGVVALRARCAIPRARGP